jgi:phosphopantothenoylcysteine decarboxylase/phosphopantothenate--cysteine ligase
VTLIYATLPSIPQEAGITAIAAPSSELMAAELFKHFPQADLTFMAAAVADVRPATYVDRKLSKAELPEQLPVVAVMDIAAALGARKQATQKLIGFAAQTGDIVTPARDKLTRKNLDAIVANPIDLPNSGFGSERNQAVWLDRAGRQIDIPSCSKQEMAHRLIDLAIELLN